MIKMLFSEPRSAAISASPSRSTGLLPVDCTAVAPVSSKHTHLVIPQSSENLLLRCLGRATVDPPERLPLPSARLDRSHHERFQQDFAPRLCRLGSSCRGGDSLRTN